MGNFKKFMLTIVLGIIALVAQFGFHQPQIAYWLIVVIGGMTSISMLIQMIQTLRSGRYGIDILAITAIIATLAVKEYWASLMILIMLTGGDSLEDYASRQASHELRSLLDNSPQMAHIMENKTIKDVPIDEVEVGQLVLVKPEEIVPVDGIVCSGTSLFDESSLTGESKRVEKKVGDELMSGSINGDQAIQMKVNKLAKNSQYQRLVRLVQESEAKPAHFVRLADRYAVPFTVVAYLIGGIAWFVSKDPVRFAEVLVVASPCPLILAAPIALVAGMSRSSRNGIVVKTGTTIEKLAALKSIAFDKTGTITEGELQVDQILVHMNKSQEELIQMAASAEQESSHILARSLVKYAKEKKISLLPVEQLKEVTGQGIEAEVDNQTIRVGKPAFTGSNNQSLTDTQTHIFVSINGAFVGEITFKDLIRSNAADTMKELRGLGVQHLEMLTGDKKEIADQIAAQVGITEIHAECLPEDKIRLLQEAGKKERPIAMVGDGVNDAPALAIADVGIAMGAHGSTAASESADVVILKDDLSRVARAVKISQATMKIARQSVLIGIFICIFLMVVASTGVIPALVGAVLQEVVDTVSILSALRAKNDK